MPEVKPDPLKRGLLTAGDVLLPGASLLANGQTQTGLLHVGAAIAGNIALGLPVSIVVAANAISLSWTGRGLLSHVMGTPAAPAAAESPLADTVKAGVAKGLTLEEIQETAREDIEDLYRAAAARQGQGPKHT